MKQHSKDYNKAIVLIGGGGHCRSVLDSLNSIDEYEEVIITDPNIPAGTNIDGVIVVGDDDILPDLFSRGIKKAFITIGSVGDRKSIELRQQLFNKVTAIGFEVPSVIDKTALVSKNAKIHDGVFVGKKAIVNAGAEIGKMAIINTGAIIEHECSVGAFSHVSIGAVLAGQAEVGEGAFIGANSTVIQCRKIGANSVIGAGSIVLSDVPANTTVVGVYNGHK
jgi:sugar O-acyltransferase (sialic acid O-acetyltransferase NeuD family)